MNKIDRLKSVCNKKERRIIGLMSGMSMDGVDLALVKVSGTYPDLKIDLEGTDFMPYPDSTLQRLRTLSHGSSSSSTGTLSQLNFEIGELFSELVISFLKKNNISADDIDAIGSHGQTVFHAAGNECSIKSSLQIGSGAVIAERTGILTVYNFRERDIAAGGVGAPLVPLADYLLFRSTGKIKTYVNLGSISNVTLVPDVCDNVLAFDMGPANMPIDYFSRKVPGDIFGYDKDSCYSSKGKVLEPLLQELLARPYFSLTPPKTLGFEEFGFEFLETLHAAYKDEDACDLVRTMVELCARSIADAYRRIILPEALSLGFPSIDENIFTGGGAKNVLLMARISELLAPLKVRSLSETDAVFSDAKEAVCFAVLANEFLSGRGGSIPRVTGVSEGTILGSVCP